MTQRDFRVEPLAGLRSLPIALLMLALHIGMTDGDLHAQDVTLRGPYLGQTPPGIIPEIFAPGVISTGAGEGCIVFSEDGRRVVFRRFGVANVLLEGEDAETGWRFPNVPAPFSRLDYYTGDFTLSPDGLSFYFTSTRPLIDGGAEPELSNAWVAEWRADGWSNPSALPQAVRSIGHQAYPTVTSDGTLYFFSWNPELGHNDIYRSAAVNGRFGQPQRLSSPINSDYQEYDPLIAPDESYLIFASNDRPGGYGDGDFYISFRGEDGSWSEPVNMGEGINSSANENRPFVTLDGKYFFFTSNREASDPELHDIEPGDRPGNGSRDIYWVDAGVIERLKASR